MSLRSTAASALNPSVLAEPNEKRSERFFSEVLFECKSFAQLILALLPFKANVVLTDAKAQFKLIERALAGEEVISKRGEPLVKLVPCEHDTSPRDMSVRIWEGEVWMAEDFDELPEDLLKMFMG